MGAQIRHLQHYPRKYAELYPHATRIIVESGPSFFWTSEEGKVEDKISVWDAGSSIVVAISTHTCRGSPRDSRLPSLNQRRHPGAYFRPSTHSRPLILKRYAIQVLPVAQYPLTCHIRWGIPIDIPRPSLVLQIPIRSSIEAPRERSHPGLVSCPRRLP